MSEADHRRLAEEQAREQGERVTARAQANYERIIAEGKAIDIHEAHARCFTGDNHGTITVTGAL